MQLWLCLCSVLSIVVVEHADAGVTVLDVEKVED
jgi:hypothetical protein